ncbi:MAG: hypothetical protein M3Z84_07920, partial [Actinomycetota bacterium]|nr:hypothetical protein [Actinomycetota bacterium]
MASPDVSELLESVAPTPRTALDIGHIECRVRHRRRNRRVVSTIACVSVVALFVGLVVTLPNSGEPKTVVAGPPASRPFPVEFGAGAATTEIRLLDGTRLRLTVPEAVGNGLAGATFANFELHGSVYAGPAPRGWAIDVVVGSIHNLVPGGEPIVVRSSSRFSAGLVDRPGHRLGLQFGAWALVASGDSLTDADIDVLV